MHSYSPISKLHDIHIRLKFLNSDNQETKEHCAKMKDSYHRLEGDMWEVIQQCIKEYNRAQG